YVTANTNQFDLSGHKTTTGSWSWSSGYNPSIVANTTVIGGTTQGQYIRLAQLGSNSISAILRGYSSSGVQLELNEGGINFISQNLLYYNGDRILAVGANTNLSGPTTGSSVYLRPNGTGNSTGQAIFAPSSITLDALTGSGTQMVTVNASGVLGRQAIPSAQTLSFNGNAGNITISGGNTVEISNVGRTGFSTPDNSVPSQGFY